MNDPTNQPIDITEQRTWLIDHRQSMGLSWNELAKRVAIPQGTLSQFGSEKGYAGNEQQLAEKVYRYRQLLASQASINVEAPEVPDFFETETSKQLAAMLGWAQRGRIVVAAMGAGLGKTKASRQYTACYPNVFHATMDPSTSGVATMLVELLDAMGEPNANGTPQRLARRVRDRLKDLSKPLLIIDEAQHLSEKSVEQLRALHDATGCGMALFGNESVMQRLEGGSRRAAFAQIFSRVSMRLVRSLPLIGDVDAMAEAWSIFDETVITYLRRIAMTPGGLRGATMALELASMLASADRVPLEARHLQDAWAQLSARSVLA